MEKLLPKFYWAALVAVSGIGRKTLHRIKSWLEREHKTIYSFWHQPRWWPAAGLSPSQRESLKQFQQKYTPREYAKILESKNIKVILYGDKNYPSLLKETDDAPFLLFATAKSPKGKCPDLEQIAQIYNSLPVAIVGTRRITPYGQLVTKKITQELVMLGATIISGCMYGVDNQAHQTALDSGGQTVGVLGYGFDHLFDGYWGRQRQKWYDQGMVFISEFPPHAVAKAGHFPLRNRIVAGMSQAVVITEAAIKSGSLITAQCALDAGRSVFAVPGSITSKYSEGTQWLLNQGATLIRSGGEVVTELNPDQGLLLIDTSADSSSNYPKNLQIALLNTLREQPLDLTTLSDYLKVSTQDLVTLLSFLEISGAIKKEGELFWLKT